MECLREVASDRHRLADALHGGREDRICLRELLECEPRHLDDDVVQGRLEAGGRLASDVVRNLVEGVADRETCSDLGDREAGRLRCERRGPRHTRVHLDDDHAAIARVDRELDIAASGIDSDRADDLDADVAHVLELAIGQGHRGSHRDRVTGVDPHRVEVLDRAHDDDIVAVIAHELEFVLLPAEDGLLEEHLGGRARLQARAGDSVQVGFVIGHPGAGASHGERGPDDDRVAEILDCGQAVIERVAYRRSCALCPDVGNDPLEDLTVLAALDGVDVGTDQLDAVTLERAALVQCDRRVERRLATEGRQDRIGPLLGNDALDELRRDRLDVRGVGELGVGHDGRRIGVHEDDPEPLISQDPACLRARVVELAGLSDDDRA